MFTKFKILPLALLAGLSFAGAAQAQWEEVYGAGNEADEGGRRVTPVELCGGGGYIAVGTKNIAGNPLVYLVRSDNNGNTLWERFYDIGNDGQRDVGYSLVELRGGGFATTGTSLSNGQWNAHLLKVDCYGNVVFGKMYVIPSFLYYRLIGHDIREAFTGDGVTTNPGDLLIAGWSEDSNFRGDGVLLRLDANGNLIWHRRYDTGANERFYGLAETRPAFSLVGDIVVVGDRWTDYMNNNDALVARIDGATGAIGVQPDQCLATYGRDGSEEFRSIVESHPPCSNADSELVMAGLSTSPGLKDDVYLVKTRANPCALLNQVTIGNETGDAFKENAMDLIEVQQQVHPGLGVPLGSFALTGKAETKYSDADAFLLFVDRTSLYPLAARRYGDNAGRNEIGISLQQNATFGWQTPGFIIAGTTDADWDGAGDPGDLYLVQPNGGAKTGCQQDWYPDALDQPWEPVRWEPHIDKVVRQVDVIVKSGDQNTVFRVCG